MPPVISVVMAVRDGEAHLDASLASLQAQEAKDFELLVVDDGSRDRTAEILKDWVRRDSRIRVLSQPAQGLSAALNRAIQSAKGHYLARQDADDVSLPSRLEHQQRYLNENPSVVAVGTAAEIMDKDARITGGFPSPHGKRRLRRALRRVRPNLVHGSVMMRKDPIQRLGGYREAFPCAQDFDLWLRLLEHGDLDNLPEKLYRWRLASEGVYARAWKSQLVYAGIALAFSRERVRYSHDSYERLEKFPEDPETFAQGYRLEGYLRAIWGELMLRGLSDPAASRRQLERALHLGFLSPKTFGLLGWTLLGWGWPGRGPLAVNSR